MVVVGSNDVVVEVEVVVVVDVVVVDVVVEVVVDVVVGGIVVGGTVVVVLETVVVGGTVVVVAGGGPSTVIVTSFDQPETSPPVASSARALKTYSAPSPPVSSICP